MFFRNNFQRAAAFAAYKQLGELLDAADEPNLPHGIEFDVSNQVVTIKLPKNTKVGRSAGPEGDGVIRKKATQNLYGYATWAFFIMRLKSFNQAKVVRQMIADAWSEALANSGKKNVEKELFKLDPELAALTAELRKDTGPKREESTPRRVDCPVNAKPEITFTTAAKVAA